MNHLQILLKMFLYILSRVQLGQKLSPDEKMQILNGMYWLAMDFFSRLLVNDSGKMGSPDVEISPCSNFYISEKPYTDHQEEVL